MIQISLVTVISSSDANLNVANACSSSFLKMDNQYAINRDTGRSSNRRSTNVGAAAAMTSNTVMSAQEQAQFNAFMDDINLADSNRFGNNYRIFGKELVDQYIALVGSLRMAQTSLNQIVAQTTSYQEARQIVIKEVEEANLRKQIMSFINQEYSAKRRTIPTKIEDMIGNLNFQDLKKLRKTYRDVMAATPSDLMNTRILNLNRASNRVSYHPSAAETQRINDIKLVEINKIRSFADWKNVVKALKQSQRSGPCDYSTVDVDAELSDEDILLQYGMLELKEIESASRHWQALHYEFDRSLGSERVTAVFQEKGLNLARQALRKIVQEREAARRAARSSTNAVQDGKNRF